MQRFEREVELLYKHLVAQGYCPGKCVDLFTRGAQDETLVVHFAQGDPHMLGDEEVEYVDCPSTIVAMLDMPTGRISVPQTF
jgi:hypothetical protein